MNDQQIHLILTLMRTYGAGSLENLSLLFLFVFLLDFDFNFYTLTSRMFRFNLFCVIFYFLSDFFYFQYFIV